QQEGMKASLSGTHVISMRQSKDAQAGEVDLSGHISGFDLKQLDRFIPVGAEPDLRHWLTKAILDGRADDVSVRIKGDLAHFPFDGLEGKGKQKSEFLIKGNLSGGKLDFTAGALRDDGKSTLWPVIDSIKGSFIFDRARMEIHGDSAKTMGVDLQKIKAIIPDLLSSNAILSIDGNAMGNLQGMLNYANASPVDGWLSHFLLESKATANANLLLKLQLPLRHVIDSKVLGNLQFINNDIVLQKGLPVVSALNGKLEFTERGVNLGALKGNLLGGAVTLSGGSQKDNSIKVRLEGVATADGIRKIVPASSLKRIADRINGSARYTAGIYVKKRQPEIVIESNLQGMELNFPAPMRKTVNDAMPLRFELLPQATADASIWRDEMKIHLGNAIHARYLRQKDNDKNSGWTVLKGGIGVNVPAPEPDSGLAANIEIDALNVDEWRRLAGDVPVEMPAANPMPVSVSDTGLQDQEPDLTPYIEPTSIAAKTRELHVFGKQLDNVVLGVSHEGQVWQANIDAKQASGYFTWNEALAGQGSGTVSARLSNLIIPKSAAADVSDLLEGNNATTQIPGLNIVAENFELFNKKLGHLELLASNQITQEGREWQIDRVSLKNADAELTATGKWASRSSDGATQLNYALEIGNAGGLLDRLGFENVVRGGKGRLNGKVQWMGMPFSMDIPSISGNIRMELANGQFLKVDPGAAKLLSVLSMQSLPRRLTLDFRDVFSEGFAFDSIVGTAKILNGVASTDNLKMRGVNATVLMDGTANLVHESQDLHVAVIPEVNAGTASVVYGLAVNPVIGLGTFLAQLFLREPLARAFTFEYQVTGPWKDPAVNKIEHRDTRKTTSERTLNKEKE
ncbi:MAG: TIGR02099 family protein, partial [Burkholderiales bacterium]|nr:TIGR02099 family protein [Burkholderiales bacterium]